MAKRTWRVRLGAVAEVDFANILKWTIDEVRRDGFDVLSARLLRKRPHAACVSMYSRMLVSLPSRTVAISPFRSDRIALDPIPCVVSQRWDAVFISRT
jgi:hypothetical protein